MLAPGDPRGLLKNWNENKNHTSKWDYV
jgi:hypothetical protein